MSRWHDSYWHNACITCLAPWVCERKYSTLSGETFLTQLLLRVHSFQALFFTASAIFKATQHWWCVVWPKLTLTSYVDIRKSYFKHAACLAGLLTQLILSWGACPHKTSTYSRKLYKSKCKVRSLSVDNAHPSIPKVLVAPHPMLWNCCSLDSYFLQRLCIARKQVFNYRCETNTISWHETKVFWNSRGDTCFWVDMTNLPMLDRDTVHPRTCAWPQQRDKSSQNCTGNALKMQVESGFSELVMVSTEHNGTYLSTHFA